MPLLSGTWRHRPTMPHKVTQPAQILLTLYSRTYGAKIKIIKSKWNSLDKINSTPPIPEWILYCWYAVKCEVVDYRCYYNVNFDHLAENRAVGIQHSFWNGGNIHEASERSSRLRECKRINRINRLKNPIWIYIYFQIGIFVLTTRVET